MDGTETRVQHNHYDHYYGTLQFVPAPSKRLRNSGHRNRPIVPWAQKIDSSSKSNNRLGAATRAGIALFLRFPFTWLRCSTVALMQEWSGADTDSKKFSTCPSWTTSGIRTPVRQGSSSTLVHPKLSTANHLSDVSRATFRRTTTASWAFLASLIVASYTSGKKCTQGLYDGSPWIVPATVTTGVSRPIPLTLKKSHGVNLANRTKLCTQVIDDSIDFWLRATPSNFVLD